MVTKMITKVVDVDADAVEVGVAVGAAEAGEGVRQVLAVTIKQCRKGHSRTSIKRVEQTITEREDTTRKWLEACHHRRDSSVQSFSRE
jgi:hypothetical protein